RPRRASEASRAAASGGGAPRAVINADRWFHRQFARLLLAIAIISIASPALAQRLPSTAVPSHYDISVQPDLESATFTATGRRAVRLVKPQSAIVLNSAEITFGTVTITAGGRTDTAKVSLDQPKEQARSTVDRPIPAGEARIDIGYRGILNDDLRGLYLSKAN